jgi:hypothetical protein
MVQQARAVTLPGVLSKYGLLTVLLGVLVTGCAHHREAEKIAKAPETPEAIGYERLYHYPLQSVGTQFAALPPAVQRTVRAEVGSAQIADIRKGTTGENLVYVVYFMKRDVMPPLYIAPDGSVLKPDLKVFIPAPHESAAEIGTGLTLNDLPPKVVATIQQRAPDAEVGAIGKETHGDNVTYVIFFKGDRHVPLYISADGTFVKEGRAILNGP